MANIVLYHFFRLELEACGLPQNQPGLSPKERIKNALPYMPRAKNTGTRWALRTLLKDLYGMKEDFLCEENWEELYEKFEANRTNYEWPKEVLTKRARIQNSAINLDEYTEWTAKRDAGAEEWKRYSEIFFPTVEQGTFVFGTVDDMCEKIDKRIQAKITDIDSFEHALRNYISPEELKSIKVFLAWATVDLYYCDIKRDEVNDVIRRCLAGEKVPKAELNKVHVFCLRTFLDVFKDYDIVVQLFFGSEFSPQWKEPVISSYGTKTMNALCDCFIDHSNQRFELLIGSMLYSQQSNIIAKMYPNVGLSGIWWHNMYPTYLRQMINERLDTVPMWKVCGFFSDAYRVEWSYGKWQMVKRELASVFAERVVSGRMSREDVREIAHYWLWENPMRTYKLDVKKQNTKSKTAAMASA